MLPLRLNATGFSRSPSTSHTLTLATIQLLVLLSLWPHLLSLPFPQVTPTTVAPLLFPICAKHVLSSHLCDCPFAPTVLPPAISMTHRTFLLLLQAAPPCHPVRQALTKQHKAANSTLSQPSLSPHPNLFLSLILITFRHSTHSLLYCLLSEFVH